VKTGRLRPTSKQSNVSLKQEPSSALAINGITSTIWTDIYADNDSLLSGKRHTQVFTPPGEITLTLVISPNT
jgi:hypothetical protein